LGLQYVKTGTFYMKFCLYCIMAPAEDVLYTSCNSHLHEQWNKVIEAEPRIRWHRLMFISFICLC